MINAEICMKFLRKYGYKTTQQGVQKILDAWKVNKAGLLEKFRQHPNWDEEETSVFKKLKSIGFNINKRRNKLVWWDDDYAEVINKRTEKTVGMLEVVYG